MLSRPVIRGSGIVEYKLRILRSEVADLHDDVSAYAAERRVDPHLMPGLEPYVTTNTSSPVLYVAQLDESFFDDYPHWRQYIEQCPDLHDEPFHLRSRRIIVSNPASSLRSVIIALS